MLTITPTIAQPAKKTKTKTKITPAGNILIQGIKVGRYTIEKNSKEKKDLETARGKFVFIFIPGNVWKRVVFSSDRQS